MCAKKATSTLKDDECRGVKGQTPGNSRLDARKVLDPVAWCEIIKFSPAVKKRFEVSTVITADDVFVFAHSVRHPHFNIRS